MSQEEMGYGVKMEDAPDEKASRGSSSDPPSKRSQINEAKRRRCVSTACIACRKRKSKCDGAQPACAACVSVYNTQCVYDPSSDHRRKGVYKKDIDGLKTRNSTLQTLIQAILNQSEDDVTDLVKKIRTCESLDKVAEGIIARENGTTLPDEEDDDVSPLFDDTDGPRFETRLANKMGELRLESGSVRLIGGTSNLLYLDEEPNSNLVMDVYQVNGHAQDPILSWTNVTADADLIRHLLNHYFTWHYTFFTILPRTAFERDFAQGQRGYSRASQYCTPLLVNAMLALGCHFSSAPGARADPEDSATAGDHFFNEAKRLIYENDLLDIPRLSTIQALALMSVREAGCSREARGWVYSGMAFRMACDLGLSFNSSASVSSKHASAVSDEEELDARRITFWGCFMIDKYASPDFGVTFEDTKMLRRCWSNYLGRLPLFSVSANVTIPKFEVFPTEDSSIWAPYSESGFSQANAQPSRVRAVALQMSYLSEISSDLIRYFYHPEQFERPPTKQTEVKRLSQIHSRLEDWRRKLPKELEPKEGTLSSVIIMHMFFQVLYIHLFRPFLKYNQATSPLPNNVSPRKLCTQASGHISKLLRLYKRSHGLRQIVNIAVYFTHSACTIHLLNLPDKNARRDITHGVKALEEIAEGWLCARRTLCVLSLQAKKWQVELPEEAGMVLNRTDAKFGTLSSPAGSSPDEQVSPPVQPRKHPDAGHPSHSDFSSAASEQSFHGGNTPQAAAAAPAPRANLSPSNQNHGNPASTSATNVQQMLNSFAVPEKDPHAYYPQEVEVEEQQQLVSMPSSWHNDQLAPAQITPAQIGPASTGQAKHIQSKKRPLPRESSQMFGGVEELLREGQDWWMKDQSAVATGFDNWSYGAHDWAQTTQQTRHRPSIGGPEQLPQGGDVTRGAQPIPQTNYNELNTGGNVLPTSLAFQSGGMPASANEYHEVTTSLGNNNNACTTNGNGGLGYGLYSNANTYNESEWYQ